MWPSRIGLRGAVKKYSIVFVTVIEMELFVLHPKLLTYASWIKEKAQGDVWSTLIRKYKQIIYLFTMSITHPLLKPDEIDQIGFRRNCRCFVWSPYIEMNLPQSDGSPTQAWIKDVKIFNYSDKNGKHRSLILNYDSTSDHIYSYHNTLERPYLSLSKP